MNIYVIFAKGKEVSHSGVVNFDSKGEWKPLQFPIEGYSELCSYENENDANWHLKQIRGNAEYYGYKCEYKVVPVEVKI